MWAFLNPFALWALAAAAIPLAIHLLGRNKLKTSPFPSLLLLKEELSQASRQNQLKNILLLILRTLFILCVVLALGNPVYRTSGQGASREVQLAYVYNNGVLAGLKTENKNTIFDLENQFSRQLDSSSKLPLKKFWLIPSASDTHSPKIQERYGNYNDAMEQIRGFLSQSTAADNHIYIPVLRYKDMLNSLSSLERLCQSFPQSKFFLLDGTPYIPTLPGIHLSHAKVHAKKPIFQLSYQISNKEKANPKARLRNFLGENLLQEMDLPSQNRELELNIPLNDNAFYTGKIALDQTEAFPQMGYFVFKAPQILHILHVGSDLASLASLGKTQQLKNIDHVPNFLSSHSDSLSKYNAIVIANPSLIPDAVFSNLQNYIKQGGTLIFIPGENIDIPRSNRNLLVPAQMGFLSNREETRLADNQNNTELELKTQSLGDIHEALLALSPSSYIAKQYQITPHLNAEVLLQSKQGPLLLRSKMEKGFLYLWTTNLDNLEWTSLGASAFLPLLHQHIIGATDSDNWKNQEVHSDSQYVIPINSEASKKFEVISPSGKIFSEITERYNSRLIGPFPKTGVYQILNGKDSNYIAVNLAPMEELEKEELDKKLQNIKNSVKWIDFQKSMELIQLEGRISLWPYFLMAAALCLLLELALIRLLAPKIRLKS